MPEPEIDAMNRMSAALGELGETAIQMVRVEREACAKVVEGLIHPETQPEFKAALVAAAAAIRTRQPD